MRRGQPARREDCPRDVLDGLLWEYPGLLYMVIVYPLGLLLGAYGLVRWGRVKWGMALILILVGLAGEVVASLLLTGVLGLSTPGS